MKRPRAVRKARTPRKHTLGGPSVFKAVLKAKALPIPEQEYRFHPVRRFRFDYAWPASLVALEIEGGVWTGGRHVHPSGYLRDMVKYNLAASMGWRVLRCMPANLCSNETLGYIAATLRAPGGHE